MAKSFWEYSRVNKTPESLSWMIRQRAWLHGRIVQLEKMLHEVIPKELAHLREQLAAIDKTMSLHDIKVDPNIIKPVRKKRPRLVPYGGLSRMLLTSMRLANGTKQSTLEITIYVIRELKMLLTRDTQTKVRRVVVTQLNDLRKRGLIVGEVPKGQQENLWRLAPKSKRYKPRPLSRHSKGSA